MHEPNTHSTAYVQGEPTGSVPHVGAQVPDTPCESEQH